MGSGYKVSTPLSFNSYNPFHLPINFTIISINFFFPNLLNIIYSAHFSKKSRHFITKNEKSSKFRSSSSWSYSTTNDSFGCISTLSLSPNFVNLAVVWSFDLGFESSKFVVLLFQFLQFIHDLRIGEVFGIEVVVVWGCERVLRSAILSVLVKTPVIFL